MASDEVHLVNEDLVHSLRSRSSPILPRCSLCFGTIVLAIQHAWSKRGFFANSLPASLLPPFVLQT